MHNRNWLIKPEEPELHLVTPQHHEPTKWTINVRHCLEPLTLVDDFAGTPRALHSHICLKQFARKSHVSASLGYLTQARRAAIDVHQGGPVASSDLLSNAIRRVIHMGGREMQDNQKLPCVCIGSVKDQFYVHVYQQTSRCQIGPFETRIEALWAAGEESDRLKIPRSPRN